MWEKFFLDNDQWVNYTTQHYVSFLVWASLGACFIWYAHNKLSNNDQHKALLFFCIFLWIVQYAKIFIRLYLGTFNYKVDLPLELCNMIPIFMTFAVWKRSRKWWGILFLWVISGTFQANLTPTLHDAFPHYEYWRYWIVHMGLTIAVLYGIVVFGYRAKLRDAWRAFLGLNVVAWSMFVINKIIGANYMYMLAKPDGATLYSMLGDWPYYLIQLQILMWVLFFIILTPFWLAARFKKIEV